MMNPTRILIVDDDPVFRRLLHIVLTSPKVEIVGEAGDGLAGQEALQRLQPDLVLMDYNMPRMNGLDAARRMRESPSCPPIVLLTSDISADLALAARRLGVRDVVSKGTHINLLGPAVLAAAGLAEGPLERAA